MSKSVLEIMVKDVLRGVLFVALLVMGYQVWFIVLSPLLGNFDYSRYNTIMQVWYVRHFIAAGLSPIIGFVVYFGIGIIQLWIDSVNRRSTKHKRGE
jgi:hypothetical protein